MQHNNFQTSTILSWNSSTVADTATASTGSSSNNNNSPQVIKADQKAAPLITGGQYISLNEKEKNSNWLQGTTTSSCTSTSTSSSSGSNNSSGATIGSWDSLVKAVGSPSTNSSLLCPTNPKMEAASTERTDRNLGSSSNHMNHSKLLANGFSQSLSPSLLPRNGSLERVSVGPLRLAKALSSDAKRPATVEKMVIPSVVSEPVVSSSSFTSRELSPQLSRIRTDLSPTVKATTSSSSFTPTSSSRELPTLPSSPSSPQEGSGLSKPSQKAESESRPVNINKSTGSNFDDQNEAIDFPPAVLRQGRETLKLNHNSLIQYTEDFLNKEKGDMLYDFLFSQADWKLNALPYAESGNRNLRTVPAKVAWYGNEGNHFYSNGEEINYRPWKSCPPLLDVKNKLEQDFNTSFNAVLCSFYINGTDYTDCCKEEYSKEGLIFLALGENRLLVMEPKRGEKAASAAKVRVSMKTNSTLYVNGPARAQFDFCVPKIEDPYLGPHMLLSFQYLQPTINSPKSPIRDFGIPVLSSDHKRTEEGTPITKSTGLAKERSLGNRSREKLKTSGESSGDNAFVTGTEILMDEKQFLKNIGQVFTSRKELSLKGIHSINAETVSGNTWNGAISILLRDKKAPGVESHFLYTCDMKAPESRAERSFLQISAANGRPVRLVRGWPSSKEDTQNEEGSMIYRYDGWYSVQSYTPPSEVKSPDPLQCKFMLRRLPNQPAAHPEKRIQKINYGPKEEIDLIDEPEDRNYNSIAEAKETKSDVSDDDGVEIIAVKNVQQQSQPQSHHQHQHSEQSPVLPKIFPRYGPLSPVSPNAKQPVGTSPSANLYIQPKVPANSNPSQHPFAPMNRSKPQSQTQIVPTTTSPTSTRPISVQTGSSPSSASANLQPNSLLSQSNQINLTMLMNAMGVTNLFTPSADSAKHFVKSQQKPLPPLMTTPPAPTSMNSAPITSSSGVAAANVPLSFSVPPPSSLNLWHLLQPAIYEIPTSQLLVYMNIIPQKDEEITRSLKNQEGKETKRKRKDKASSKKKKKKKKRRKEEKRGKSEKAKRDKETTKKRFLDTEEESIYYGEEEEEEAPSFKRRRRGPDGDKDSDEEYTGESRFRRRRERAKRKKDVQESEEEIVEQQQQQQQRQQEEVKERERDRKARGREIKEENNHHHGGGNNNNNSNGINNGVRRKGEKKARAELDKGEEDADAEAKKELFCLCRSPEEYGFMIACDKCNEWFHGGCVGLTPAEGQMLKTYICPRCSAPTERPLFRTSQASLEGVRTRSSSRRRKQEEDSGSADLTPSEEPSADESIDWKEIGERVYIGEGDDESGECLIFLCYEKWQDIDAEKEAAHLTKQEWTRKKRNDATTT